MCLFTWFFKTFTEDGDSKKSAVKITTPYMTKYERARVLGTRALQIAMCAPVMVELEGETFIHFLTASSTQGPKCLYVVHVQSFHSFYVYIHVSICDFFKLFL